MILVPLLLIFSVKSFAEVSYKILVVQSFIVKPYEDALEGFKETCDYEIRKIVISDSDDSDLLLKIKKINPDVILAIGMNALSKVMKIKDIPIIYIMILNPQSILSEEKNITGIRMNIDPEKQLSEFQNVLPNIKKIGILYDSANMGYFIKRIQNAAKKKGIECIIEEAHNSKEVPSLIYKMKDEIDAFWMLPDTTIISPETIEFLFLFSIENKIPILTFSEKFVEIGGLMSVSAEAIDIGRQACMMIKDIVSGAAIMDIFGMDAENITLSINLKVAKKLGISVDKRIIKKVKIVY